MNTNNQQTISRQSVASLCKPMVFRIVDLTGKTRFVGCTKRGWFGVRIEDYVPMDILEDGECEVIFEYMTNWKDTRILHKLWMEEYMGVSTRKTMKDLRLPNDYCDDVTQKDIETAENY